ncbi:MAG: hypothetical protein IJL56_06725 [Bacteroidales bacterium]|nr:hypothetical protein [Bacteroidales bacterium]
MLLRRLFVLLAAGLLPVIASAGTVTPGSVSVAPVPDGGLRMLGKPLTGEYPPLLSCYRSFKKQPDMGRIFHDELGVKGRCFAAGNVLNGLGQGYCDYPPIWVGEGKYEFEHLDEQMIEMEMTNPDGGLICMIDLDTPVWLTRKLRMDSFTHISIACSNPRWREMTMRYMKDLIAYAEEHYGDRIDAYMLCGGSTYEWLDHLHGYTTADKDRAWADWQKKHGVQYEASAPSLTALHTAAFENRLYDPATEQEKADYWRFNGEVVGDALMAFAREARAMLPKNKQIGAFFGYIWSINNGHMDSERVLTCPDIDFFAAPASYGNREIGKGTGSGAFFHTAMLHGKRLMHEIDCRPHDLVERAKRRHQEVRDRHQWFSQEEDIVGNVREACFALVNHADYWWFDQWGAYYDDPKVREWIARMEPIQQRFKDDMSPSVAEILLVSDTRSMFYLKDGDPWVGPLVERLRNRVNRFGAPFDCCLFSDLEKLDLSQYKIIMLPHLFVIDDARARLLREKVCTPGRTVLFTYAPGAIDGKTLDTKRVEAWTGVPYATGKGDETETGIITTAMPGGWTAVYAWNPVCFTETTTRKVCEAAGVHFYVDDLWPVFANERLLTIHCKEGGERTVRLPRKVSQVVDLFTGEVVAKKAKSFKVNFASPDIRLYELIP